MTASIEGSGGGGKEKEGEVSAMDAGDDPVTVLLARGVVVGGEDYFIFIGIDGKDPNPKERKMRHTVGFWERADEFLDPGECYFICADGGVVATDMTAEQWGIFDEVNRDALGPVPEDLDDWEANFRFEFCGNTFFEPSVVLEHDACFEELKLLEEKVLSNRSRHVVLEEEEPTRGREFKLDNYGQTGGDT